MSILSKSFLRRFKISAWFSSAAEPKAKLGRAFRESGRARSDERTSAWAEDVTKAWTNSPCFASLPFDVLMEILMYLEVVDVLSLAQVSRHLHSVSSSHSLWKNIAYRILCRSRPLLVRDHDELESLSAGELRRCVLHTAALERNWNRTKPKTICKPQITKLDCNFLDCLCYVVNFAPKHLLMPMNDGFLTGWDIEKNEMVGSYQLDPTLPATIINARAQYNSHSFYFVIGKFPMTEPDFHFSILHVQFPTGSTEVKMTFDSLAEFSMPLSIAIEVHILDTERRMIAVLFLCPASDTLGVCIIFDWDTGLASMTDTGLPYQFRRTMIGVRLSEDGSAVIVHSEMDECEMQRSFSLSELEAEATPWRYTLLSSCPTLKPLEDISFHWRVQAADGSSSTSLALSRPTTQHDSHSEFDVDNFPESTAASEHSLAGASPLRVWICRQYWPLLPGVPERTSRIVLYDTVTPEGTTWRISQNYSPTGTGDGVSPGSSKEIASQWHMDSLATTAPIRFVTTIANPVLTTFGQQNLPILGITFNHISWIELVPVRRLRSFGRKRTKRVMKLLTFPDPESAVASGPPALRSGSESGTRTAGKASRMSWSTKPSRLVGRRGGSLDDDDAGGVGLVKTLDIPERVLEKACHIIVDPTLGTVTITSTSNELFVYRYA